MRRAFTLLELLVVLTIVSLLLAMLLPVIGVMRDAARQVSCLSNLRQLQLADFAYAGEHRGMVTPNCINLDYGTGNPNNVFRPLADLLDDYLPKGVNKANVRPVWMCPQARVVMQTTQWPMTYGANTTAHPGHDFRWWATPQSNGYPNRRLAEIVRPSEVLSFGDAAQASGAGTAAGWLDSTGYSSVQNVSNGSKFIEKFCNWEWQLDSPTPDRGGYCLRWRHRRNTMACVVFMDGHAAAVRRYELQVRNLATAY
jgi:prepilin-type N-terminal cleavage/methylation domain-containing protein